MTGLSLRDGYAILNARALAKAGKRFLLSPSKLYHTLGYCAADFR
jgi:hypothetical protein